MESSVRVLIAEDHPLFREGMRGRLDRVADITVVGEAASGEEAVELARKLEPDVILMDIKMPGLNGIEATREILRASPGGVGVLVLTMFEDDDSVFAAMRAGARGYLLKDSGGEGVVHAIRRWQAEKPSSELGLPSASWVSSLHPAQQHLSAPSLS
jgi:DNA-binding NarL/FixJ family response regulator